MRGEGLKDEFCSVNYLKLHVEAEAQPLFFKARTAPFALRQKVEQELERLEQEGVVEPVKFSDLAAPIVPVMKGDGRERICGDYKLTINKVTKLEGYPLPRIDELFASLSGGPVVVLQAGSLACLPTGTLGR